MALHHPKKIRSIKASTGDKKVRDLSAARQALCIELRSQEALSVQNLVTIDVIQYNKPYQLIFLFESIKE